MWMPRVYGCALVAAIYLAAFLPTAPASAAEAPQPTCSEGPVVADGTVYGTPCDDRIVAPAGVAAVEGGGGDDTIVAAPIAAAVDCSAGCFLDIGSQTFEGGPGNDLVFGERGNDHLFGGEGDDHLFGGIGDDLLRGGPGDDRLAGGFGFDAIDGEADDDYVRGDATIDEIVDRGGGTDTLSYSTAVTPGFFNGHTFDPTASQGLPPLGGARGVYIDLTGTEGDNGVAPMGGGVDEVEGGDFEVVIGSAFSDYIVGSGDNEIFYGGGGGDVILAASGDDSLRGGADGDHLDGGEGSDAIDGGPGSDRCVSASSAGSCERGASENGVVLRDPGTVGAGLMAPEDSRAQAYLVGSDEDDVVTVTYAPGANVTFHLESGSDAPFGSDPSASAGCNPPAGATLECPLTKPLDSVLIAGLDGDDVLKAGGFPGSVSLVIAGGEGSDSLTGGEQSEDVLADGPDDDGPGNDTLSALGGDDALLNNGGQDDAFGDAGNDLFLSNSICDDDLIDGGSERDNGSWTKFDSAVSVWLGSGGAGEPGSGGAPECASGSPGSLVAIEDLEGTVFGDVFRGDGGENQLLGWAGADTYSSGAGADRILANSGDSDPTVACGEGKDTALIDRPPHVDGVAADCEVVREADVNNFRVETELEVPVTPETGTAGAPRAEPKPPVVRRQRSCLASTRRGPLRCTVRPRHLRLGALGRLDRIGWKRWGSRLAIGFGRLTIAPGRRIARSRAPARIRVGSPRSCDSSRWYTRITVGYGRDYRKAIVRGAISKTPCG
jgi:Ca2+-binding RTX toxin-like protein